MKSKLVLTLGSLACLFATSALAAPKVVVSIKPIHSLTAAIMKNVGTPGLIVEGAASPHTYQMRPSQASMLQEADVVFWVGHGLEGFLEKPLETLGSKARIVELDSTEHLVKLEFRDGGAFDKHAHDDEEAGHDAGEHATEDHAHEAEGHAKEEHAHESGHAEEDGHFDMHLWLDTNNAKVLAAEIARVLGEADPANIAVYNVNLAELNTRLDALAVEIEATTSSFKDKPVIVFHDAYQYFEHRFGVRVAGSITVSPETAPGAERLSNIKAKIAELKATCVFSEPQFEPKVVNMLVEGTGARSGTLDPEGGSLEPGPDHYFTLMRNIAENLKSCLAQG